MSPSGWVWCSSNCAWSVSKAEKEVVQEAVLKAVEEERRNMEKIHAEERKLWEAERDSHKEKIAQAVSEAMIEQRKQNQVSMFYPSMHLLCVVLVLLLYVFCCGGRFSCDICHLVDVCNAQQAVYLHLGCVYGEAGTYSTKFLWPLKVHILKWCKSCLVLPSDFKRSPGWADQSGIYAVNNSDDFHTCGRLNRLHFF